MNQVSDPILTCRLHNLSAYKQAYILFYTAGLTFYHCIMRRQCTHLSSTANNLG